MRIVNTIVLVLAVLLSISPVMDVHASTSNISRAVRIYAQPPRW